MTWDIEGAQNTLPIGVKDIRNAHIAATDDGFVATVQVVVARARVRSIALTAVFSAPSGLAATMEAVPCPGQTAVQTTFPCYAYDLSWTARPGIAYRVYETYGEVGDSFIPCDPWEARVIAETEVGASRIRTGTYVPE